MTDDLTSDTWNDLEVTLLVENGEETAVARGEVIGGELHLQLSTQDEPLVLPVSAAPLQIAAWVALGPRPLPTEESFAVACPPVASLTRDALLAALDEEDREGTPLAVDGAVYWTAIATWNVGDETLVRFVTAVDGGEAGIALVQNDEDGLLVIPSSSTDVWQALAGLLPFGFELSEPAVADDAEAETPA